MVLAQLGLDMEKIRLIPMGAVTFGKTPGGEAYKFL